jgi:hypothetical protein
MPNEYRVQLKNDDGRRENYTEEWVKETGAISSSLVAKSLLDRSTTSNLPITEDGLNMELMAQEADEEEGDQEKRGTGEVNSSAGLSPSLALSSQTRSEHRRSISQSDNPDDADGTSKFDTGTLHSHASPLFSLTLRDQAKTGSRMASSELEIPPPKKPRTRCQLTRQFNTPRDLAVAFGDIKARVSALMQDWDRLSRSQVLHEVVMPQLATNYTSTSRTYLDLLVWHGQQLDKNTLEGQLHLLQSRFDYANYCSLYNVALEDVSQNKDPLFFRLRDDWLRQRGRSSQRRWVGPGYRATCAVIDRLVEIYSLQYRFTGKSIEQMKRMIQNWRK